MSGCATWPGFSEVCACLSAPPPPASEKLKPAAKTNCPEPSPAVSKTANPRKLDSVKSSTNSTTLASPAHTKANAVVETSPKPRQAPKTKQSEIPKPKIKKIQVRPTPPKKAKPQPPILPSKKRRILMVGDSMAATDFGRALQKKLNRHPSIKCYRKGKSSTGLARPDFFDWMGEGARQVRRSNPDVVIVIVGGNDGQDLIDKEKKKRRIFWKGKKWAKSYKQRITDFINLLAGERRKVLWLELPAMDHRRLERKLKIIRRIQLDTVSNLGSHARYIPTRPHFYDSKDRLIRKISVPKKSRKALLRQEDGIHFSLPGSRYFANKVYKQVLDELEL